jgi:hypothetical protein
MSDISPSSIKMTPEMEEHIKTLVNTADITDYLKNVSVEQGLLKRDWDPALFIETAQPAAPTSIETARGYSKTVTVNGVQHILQGATEADILKAETEFFRKTFSNATQQTQQTQQQEQPRDTSTGRFVSAEDAAEKERVAGLELQFSLGQLTLSQFLEQSGVVEQYQQKQAEQNTVRGWEDATARFLASPEGANWPGADALPRITEILQANHLENAEDKLSVMKQAWALMQQEDTEVEVERAISEINDPYELRNRLQPGTSGLFGR